MTADPFWPSDDDLRVLLMLAAAAVIATLLAYGCNAL